MPKTSSAAVVAPNLERRQGKQQPQQLEKLLSRPSRRAEVILGAASLLPFDEDYEKFAASSSSSLSSPPPPSSELPPRRRSLLAAALLLPPLSAAASSASLLLLAARRAEAAEENELHSSPKGFSLAPPKGWLLKSKPGADVLFASPRSSRATIGVTTAPVRLDALSDFGSVAEVADRLLGAELAKDGCLSATLRLSSEGRVPGEWSGSRSPDSSRSSPSASPSPSPPSSSPLYYFEYELLTTRVHKVVVVAVGVSGRTLFIANGFAPCAKGDGAACPPVSLPSSLSPSPSPSGGNDHDAPSAILAEVRRSVSTFSIS